MSNNNDNNNNGFDGFRKRHPFLVNIPLMILALIAIGYIALLFIDVFTSHGQQVQVPDVRNMSMDKATKILDDAGLHWEIDSTTYSEQYMPGQVIDQDPKPNSYVKKIRIIYLKVNAMHAPLMALPRLQDIPGRQGLASLQSLGFKHVEVDSIPSEMEGLILQVTVNGHKVASGTKVSVNSVIKITVGDGSIKDLNPERILDEAAIDSIEEANYEDDQLNYEQAMEEKAAREEQERKEKAAQERRNKEKATTENKNKEKK